MITCRKRTLKLALTYLNGSRGYMRPILPREMAHLSGKCCFVRVTDFTQENLPR